MTLLILGVTLRRLGIGAACIATLLICAAAGHETGAPGAGADRDTAFIQATAGINGRILMLRQFEREMLAHAANPDRADLSRRKRSEARRRIDELAVLARTNALTGERHAKVEQLAMLAGLADVRFNTIFSQINHGEMR